MAALMTIEDVAETLRVPVNTVRKWRTKDYGPKPFRVGKYLRWKPEVVEAWIDAQEPESNVTPIRGVA